MQVDAKGPGISRNHLKIIKVVDGDGLWVEDIFTKTQEEIRLPGIDAPEIKRCRKLIQDERETHLPEQLLKEPGLQSWQYLRGLAQIGVSVSIRTERNYSTDPYGRTLAYVFLPDGSCLNEKMIEDGFAKPYNKYYCNSIAEYQRLNFLAKIAGKGLYFRVTDF